MSISWVREMHVRHSEAIESLPDDARILTVNGRIVVARCRECGNPIMHDSTYSFDESAGNFVCGSCVKKIEELANERM